MTFLEIKSLTKHFGGLTAVEDVTFDITRGKLFSIIGPNGAGKTTLFNMITGFLRPSHGKILFEGEDITGKKAHVVAQKGIVRTFQVTTLFKNQTVFENVVVAHHIQSRASLVATIFNTPSAQRDDVMIEKKSIEILELIGLGDLKNELASNLPHGHQRKLELCIALAVQPKLLLLDEPVTGMNPEEMADMMNLIKNLAEMRGLTVILVEHDMKAVMDFSDRIMVLNYGRRIAEGAPEEIRKNAEVIEAYLGREGALREE